MTWGIATTPPTISSDDESYLESRFRKSFMALARRLNATVSQNYGPGGNVINVRIGQVLYTLQPQVLMPGCKPDFVLRGGDRPDLAIFTGGATFHATPECNRVRDDAEKRAGLRNLGVEVLAVTLDDVNDFEAGRDPAAPEWFNASVSSKLISLYDYTPDAVRAVTGGPFALLEYWMRGEPLEALKHFASAIPMFFSTNSAPDGYIDSAVPIAAVKQEDLHDSQRGNPEAARAWWHQDGPLSIRTRLRASSFPPASDICVVLDDDAVNNSAFLGAWHRWLALSNALMLRDASDQTVILGCVKPQEPSGQEAAVTDPVIDIAQTPWPTVIKNLGPSLATPELPGLLEDLAAQGGYLSRWPVKRSVQRASWLTWHGPIRV